MLDVMNRMIEEQVRFKMKYPDYPLSLEKLDTDTLLAGGHALSRRDLLSCEICFQRIHS